MFHVKHLAIAANGPSAARHGRDVDAADFVVRINNWTTRFAAGAAGTRMDALAWYAPKHFDPYLYPEPNIDCEFWLCLRPLSPKNIDDANRAFRIANLRPVRVVTEKMWNSLQKELKAIPGTALQAVFIAMALRPKTLRLYGFDYGPDYAPSFAKANHNPEGESALIDRLANDHDWIERIR